MTLGYLLGGGVGAVPHGTEMYDAFPGVRRTYDEVAGLTGVPVERMLVAELPEDLRERRNIGLAREAASALAVHEQLAVSGVRPGAIGGLSLGAMTASCLAGAVDRDAFLDVLVRSAAHEEPSGGPEEGLAIVAVPAAEDANELTTAGEVYRAGYFGRTADDAQGIYLLAGHLAALHRLAGERPAGQVTVLPGRAVAVHTPLRSHLRDALAPHIGGMAFTAPKIPLYSCFDEKRLTTAEEVRDVFLRNPVDPIDLTQVTRAMHRDGVELAVVIGGSIPEGLLSFPFPVVHVQRPEDIEKLLLTAYELGVELPVEGIAP
jgi:[acyl-carrier-protein] S-malonyltransferase